MARICDLSREWQYYLSVGTLMGAPPQRLTHRHNTYAHHYKYTHHRFNIHIYAVTVMVHMCTPLMLCTPPQWYARRCNGMHAAAMVCPPASRHFPLQLGPAPRWCSFLDNLTEELQEERASTV